MTEDGLGGITLVAIAKDESKFLVDWLGYHLALGFDRVRIYSNDSTDRMEEMLAAIAAADPRVSWTPWPSKPGVSPQVSAYADGAKVAETEWVGFLDMDEYFNPFGYEDAKDFFTRLPADVGSIHINWRNFGSGGQTSPDYPSVRTTFRNCAPRGFGNHHHFKSFGRRALVESVAVHDIQATSGRRVLSDFEPFETRNRGLSDRIVHQGVQINHYQCKTFDEFQARMRRGSANWPAGSAGKVKNDSRERFEKLDRNEEIDKSIGRFDERVNAEIAKLQAIVATLPAAVPPKPLASPGLIPAANTNSEFAVRMTKPELELFKSALRSCDRYFEFGMGGSTALAAATVRKEVCAVESDQAWIAQVRASLPRNDKLVRLLFADIGPTGKWGFPVEKNERLYKNYHLKQSKILAEGFDLYLIDGRFRVACFALAAKYMPADGILACHDYRSRPHYHVVEKIARPIAEAGDLTLFARRSATTAYDCEAIYDKAKFDPR